MTLSIKTWVTIFYRTFVWKLTLGIHCMHFIMQIQIFLVVVFSDSDWLTILSQSKKRKENQPWSSRYSDNIGRDKDIRHNNVQFWHEILDHFDQLSCENRNQLRCNKFCYSNTLQSNQLLSRIKFQRLLFVIQVFEFSWRTFSESRFCRFSFHFSLFSTFHWMITFPNYMATKIMISATHFSIIS